MIASLNEWEAELLGKFQNFIVSDSLTPLVKLITSTAELGFVSILVFFILALNPRTRKASIVVGSGILLTMVISTLIIKPLVLRARPFDVSPEVFKLIVDPGDSSFPSGHTSNMFALAFSLYFASHPRYKQGIFDSDREARLIHTISKFAIILAFMVGLSRIYLGVHYFSDVLAGALIGTMVAFLITKFAPAFLKNFDRRVLK